MRNDRDLLENELVLYDICDFHLGTKFLFTLHDTRIKFHTRTRISFRMKTRMKLFRNDLYMDKISSWYRVNRCREICGDAMNSFQSDRFHTRGRIIRLDEVRQIFCSSSRYSSQV